ncbi:hypothetical protein AVEN_67089-1 [Araneus ventricosus]|uniref:Uncharacterized protein n=1 Tax=Araneus ventricosus TaxID=182803 RepID=A0A4Y2FQ18_ARAVE|nr:hypothetical protein AVEN_67089-1 [Araneus ventricosus]
MSSNTNENNHFDDPLSALSAASEKIKDLEMRVCDVLTKQQEMQNELHALKTELTDGVPVESSPEEASDIQFPEDYHFTEELKKIMGDMQNSQKSWIENVKNMSKAETGIARAASDVFRDMEKHLSQRLEYLQAAKALIEGPLVEEPPPPPPPPQPEEPPEPEEEKKGKKDKKKKK